MGEQSAPIEKQHKILLANNQLLCCAGELLNATLHYKGREAWEVMKSALNHPGFHEIQLNISTVSLKTYIKEMYKEGRWA